MAPKRKTPLLHSPISIGNCEVVVDAKNFTTEWNQNTLQISLSRNAKIGISVNRKDDNEYQRSGSRGDYYFVLVNPKDADEQAKSLLQDVLKIYTKELPAMNYAANTGKESMFLGRCVSSGKYCTLLLKTKPLDGPGEVIAAITYQIIPADTLYAEVPLAAVRSTYQHKGIGHLLYTELTKRLQNVGIGTIFCWGDKESEGFWLKQGFVSIGEVDAKGRARRLPIKAEIRRALCFPGGSTLMVSHLDKNSLSESLEIPKPSLQLVPLVKSSLSVTPLNQTSIGVENSQPENLARDAFLMADFRHIVPIGDEDCSNHIVNLGSSKTSPEDDTRGCSSSTLGAKRRVWESSYTSLKSKKVKGSHQVDCQLDFGDFVPGSDERNCWDNGISSAVSGNKSFQEGNSGIPFTGNPVNIASEECGSADVRLAGDCFRIMLMNIADDAKRSRLTKIIEDLGGAVTSDGSTSTHVVTGKVRKTLNFCSALCSGAWIISPGWLKESFHRGRFIEETPFILKDENYESKYRSELKVAVLRARSRPHALLKGFDICLATHVQPPASTLSAIVGSAGGTVVQGLNKVNGTSRTIFVACEEDMEEALSAVKKGIWTFSTDWFMNCIMKQELDLEAPQFAQSL